MMGGHVIARAATVAVLAGAFLWSTGGAGQEPAARGASVAAAGARSPASADDWAKSLGAELMRLNDRLASLERLIVQLVSQQDEDRRSLTAAQDEIARLRTDLAARAAAVPAASSPDDVRAAEVIAPKLQPEASEPVPVDRFEQAVNFMERKQWGNAELALATFIANSPDDPRNAEARYRLGLVYLEQGQPGQAARNFLALFETGAAKGFGADNLFALARALKALGNVDAAQVCSVYSEIEAAHGAELSASRREELLDLRLADGCAT